MMMMIINMDNHCEQPQMFLERWGSRDGHTCGEYPIMMMMMTMMMVMVIDDDYVAHCLRTVA